MNMSTQHSSSVQWLWQQIYYGCMSMCSVVYWDAYAFWNILNRISEFYINVVSWRILNRTSSVSLTMWLNKSHICYKTDTDRQKAILNAFRPRTTRADKTIPNYSSHCKLFRKTLSLCKYSRLVHRWQTHVICNVCRVHVCIVTSEFYSTFGWMFE